MIHREQVVLNKYLIRTLQEKQPFDSKILVQSLYNNYNSRICSLLLAYADHRSNIHDFEIQEYSVEIENGVLLFTVIYNEHTYLGCQDMNYSSVDLEMNIKLGIENDEYYFFGEDRLERDPDDF